MPHASSSAVLLVAIKITISFPRIESFRNRFMSALRRGSITPNGSRHPQQLRTHFEPGARCSAQIDFKPHSFVFDEKVDCSAGLQKSIGLADGQDISALQGGQNLCQAVWIGHANKQNLTIPKVIFCCQNPNLDLSPMHGFSGDRFRERSPEQISADHSDYKRLVLARKRTVRPLDKLGEVRQILGFYAVFTGRRRLRPGGKVQGKRQESSQDCLQRCALNEPRANSRSRLTRNECRGTNDRNPPRAALAFTVHNSPQKRWAQSGPIFRSGKRAQGLRINELQGSNLAENWG